MDLHPELESLSFLVGNWAGRGFGEYPTIEPFEYTERLAIAHAGKPFLEYRQRTRDAATTEPLHTEAGYFRPVGENGVELVIAQTTGIVELLTGTIDGTSIHLTSTHVVHTPTAKEILKVERRLSVDNGRLHYELWMEAVGQQHLRHLKAELEREDL